MGNVLENEELFIQTLNKPKSIIMEGLISTYSLKQKCYIDIGCILTSNYMYLINTNNYNLWIQFQQRTKIQSLSSDVINDKMAIKILENLNISTNDSNACNQIKSYLIDKTLYDIKWNILLQSNMNKNSLHTLFELKSNEIKISHFYDAT